MKEKKDCKIVQDLLPSYIDKLTSEETNQYIEKHFIECRNCKKILDEMQNNLNISNKKASKKEIDYIKKFNRKLNKLKAIILLIILIVFIILGRRTIIILDLMEKAKQSKDYNNYHTIFYQYEGENINIIEEYKKEDKVLTTLKSWSGNSGNEQYSKNIIYRNGEYQNIYYDVNGTKFAQLHVNLKDEIFPIMKVDILNTNNLWEFLSNIISSSIRSVECNGVKCYYFSELKGSSTLIGGGHTGIYIDKETGLTIRTLGQKIQSNEGTYDVINDFKYEFNLTTDEDVKEPNINEYNIE